MVKYRSARESVSLEESPCAFLRVGELGMGRGVFAAGEAVMTDNVVVSSQSVPGRSGPMVGNEAGARSDCKSSSDGVGCLISSEAGMSRGPN